MKRMLINATHSEEIRVALADGQKLFNLDIDIPGQDRKKGNIYKGIITRVEPSLEAAFVNYGSERHGFLPFKEISRNYYTAETKNSKDRPSIADAVKEGTEVIIQVNKEERGNKGAALSTYISLAGRYLVYMPENPKSGGISRRIEGKSRADLKSTLSQINQPKNSGVIVRTAGIGRSVEELDWDLNYLDQVWTAIKTMAASRPAPFFIYQESDIFIRALRDYLRPDVGEILIDDKEIYEKARDFMQQVMPHNLKKLSYYNDTTPLFSRYQIEGQIQSAFAREVRLPSGGSLVIDHTEAMISIDINSAKATRGADIEETATMTNLEAADEIARQLRIRDLGGLVVIDFIDMRDHKNQRLVEEKLNEAVENDRARVQVGKISRFGLLEMSRQRLRSSINESSQFVCPRCSGHGFIRNIESLSVSILRIVEEEAQKPETGKVIAQVPSKVANFIINEKRTELFELEKRHKVPLLIVANEYYQTPHFDVTRLKKSEAGKVDINNLKLNKPENEEGAESKSMQAVDKVVSKAAVGVLIPEAQAPKPKNGFVKWLKSLFSKDNSKNKKKKPYQKDNKNRNSKPKNRKAPQNRKPATTPNNNQNTHQNNKPKGGRRTPYNNGNRKDTKPNKPNTQADAQNKAENNKSPANKRKPKPAQKPNVKQQDVQQQTSEPAVSTKATEQIMKRPLGSVASYAAQKQQETQSSNSQNANKVDVENTNPSVKTTDKIDQSSQQTSQSKDQKQKSTKPNRRNKPTNTQAGKTDNQSAAPKTQTEETKVVNSEKAMPKQNNEQSNTTDKPMTDNSGQKASDNQKVGPEKTLEVNNQQPVEKTTKKTTKKTAKKKTSKKVSNKKAENTKSSTEVKKDESKPVEKNETTAKPNTSKEEKQTQEIKKPKPVKKVADPTSGINFDI